MSNNANDILFRCSSLGYLMKDPKGKSPKEKYSESVERVNKLMAEYDSISNKGTKTAINKLESLQKTIKERDILKSSKDDIFLGETVKTHLVDVYVSRKYNRFTEINAKQLDKGNETEEDSITTVSLTTGLFLKKNEETLKNEFIQGTLDLYTGKSIKEADTVRDTKSSWDVYSFNRAIHSDLNELYYWQGTGYMWLTGAKKCFIDYCLNNTPWQLIEGELRKEHYKHIENENGTPKWIEAQIIANHVYDKKTFIEYCTFRDLMNGDENCQAVIAGFVEIPLEERHYAFEFERNEDDIKRLMARIIECRIYMNKYLFKTSNQLV